MPAVNWLAVVAAAVSMFVIGGIWYGPLFDKAWMAANRFTADDMKRGSMPVIFGGAFVFALLIAANLAFFVAGVPDLGTVIAYSVAAGLGFAGFALGHIALFERRPPAYFLINIGYLTVAFAVMGLILGLWR
jgi:multidrug transporter EmrE-like cation transporter